MRYLLVLSVFLSVSAPSFAEDAAEPAADSEQLSKDLLKNVDDWIGQVNTKLQSDKPVTSEDFDSVFNEAFFSGSEDPIRDIELAQKRINEKLGVANKSIDAPYNKWVQKKLSAADLSPQVVSDEDHVTLNLKTPESAADSMKITIDKSRIKLNYNKRETRQDLQPDGSVTSSSFMRRNQRMMAVPKGANTAKYKIKTSKGTVSIIFDRLRKNRRASRQEASK